MSIISLYQAWNLAWGSESWTHLGTFYLPITDRHCCVIPVRISTGKWLLHLRYFAVIISPSRRTPSTFKCSAFIHIVSFSIQGHITTHAAQSAPLNNLLIDRESLTNTTSGSRGAYNGRAAELLQRFPRSRLRNSVHQFTRIRRTSTVGTPACSFLFLSERRPV